jgi:hypothetical protein
MMKDSVVVIEFYMWASYTRPVLSIRVATVRKFLFIIIFLCQHIAMASEAMVLHLPDDSHHFLAFVSQPHTHADLHHDHEDEDHHADDSTLAVTAEDLRFNTVAGHDAGAHEHVQHVHIVADIPSESSLTFCAPVQEDIYHYASQLTAVTYSPPVPPPNA